MEKCYKLHGYPPGYKAKGKNPKANQIAGPEFGDVLGGVESDLVPMQQPYPPQAFSFTPDQYQRLLAVIGGPDNDFQAQGSNAAPETTQPARADSVSVTTPLASKSCNLKHSVFAAKVVNRNAYSCNTWVLDIDATDHIISSATLLTTITSLTHSIVELHNGESAQVTHIGIVQLSATLILDNVLCVPSFSFNLLSISKLNQKLSYCLIFLSQFCFIQDLLSWKMIGIGEVHHGLYLLQRLDCVGPLSNHLIKHKLGSSSHFANDVSSMPRIWHFRLGHPSLNKLVSLQDSLSISFDTCTDICNICPMAKQKRLSFPFNNNFFDSPFDLVHVDI